MKEVNPGEDRPRARADVEFDEAIKRARTAFAEAKAAFDALEAAHQDHRPDQQENARFHAAIAQFRAGAEAVHQAAEHWRKKVP